MLYTMNIYTEMRSALISKSKDAAELGENFGG
jgi:hypothetical protein